MKNLYEFYGGDENVAQAVRQIPWGHNIEIFQKIGNTGLTNASNAGYRKSIQVVSWFFRMINQLDMQKQVRHYLLVMENLSTMRVNG